MLRKTDPIGGKCIQIWGFDMVVAQGGQAFASPLVDRNEEYIHGLHFFIDNSGASHCGAPSVLAL